MYGRVCIEIPSSLPYKDYIDADYEIGVLFAQNGGAARVRYADLSAWTGDPIPDPTTCPNLGVVQPCGGSCGTCPQGQVCFGGSPLHPVGYCAPNYHVCVAFPADAGPTQVLPSNCIYDGGTGCFTFDVQPDAQAEADRAGTCFPVADCNGLAQNLPGGGKCSVYP